MDLKVRCYWYSLVSFCSMADFPDNVKLLLLNVLHYGCGVLGLHVLFSFR